MKGSSKGAASGSLPSPKQEVEIKKVAVVSKNSTVQAVCTWSQGAAKQMHDLVAS